VDLNIVNGQILVEKGELVGLELPRVLHKQRQLSSALRQ